MRISLKICRKCRHFNENQLRFSPAGDRYIFKQYVCEWLAGRSVGGAAYYRAASEGQRGKLVVESLAELDENCPYYLEHILESSDRGE